MVKPAEDACLSLIRVVAQLAPDGDSRPGHQHRDRLRPRGGRRLARHPGVDHISFTGSPSVGTLIQQVAKGSATARSRWSWRQESADRLRRCRPGRRHPCHPQRDRAERRADLLAGSRCWSSAADHESLLERLGQRRSSACASAPPSSDLGRRPVDPGRASSSGSGISATRRWPASRWWRRARWWTRAPDRLLPGPAAARRAGGAPAGAGRGLRPGAVGHGLRDEDQAVERVWPTPPASAWSPASGRATARRQFRMARRVKSGQVFINNYGAGGGVETAVWRREVQSGYGREKGFEALYGSRRSRRWRSATAERHGVASRTTVRIVNKGCLFQFEEPTACKAINNWRRKDTRSDHDHARQEQIHHRHRRRRRHRRGALPRPGSRAEAPGSSSTTSTRLGTQVVEDPACCRRRRGLQLAADVTKSAAARRWSPRCSATASSTPWSTTPAGRTATARRWRSARTSSTVATRST